MRESATILKVLHHFCRMSPGWEKTWNFQHKSTFVNLILEKIAKVRGSASKNCHISDLKITNCTHPAGECRTRLWKTQWRMLNSTGKTGFAAGLLNFLHRVFNMWKKSGPSTECIALFCGKLFGPAKRQVPAGAEGAAARDNSAKPGRGAGKL